ncbi:MAG: MFS transporter [Candidatus Methanomethylophilaceae archaeon]
MSGLKLTPMEKSWVMYDVGNSAFILMLSTVIPIFFNAIAGDSLSAIDYLAFWGYAASIATLLCAFIGPVLGSISDRKGMRMKLFTLVLCMGALGCAALGFVDSWLAFLVILVITRLMYSLSLILYDSMLVDVTTIDRMDSVSSSGYAWGYIGSCVPFIACLVLILGCDSIGITMSMAMTVSMIVIAVWWVAASLPLIRKYVQKNHVDDNRNALGRLWNTIKGSRNDKKVLLFLLAFFFYIDGVYTIIEMATAYGEALGLESSSLLMALLLTQVVAFPCCIAFGRLSYRFDSAKLILVCIAGYMFITLFAVFMTTATEFWMLAFMVGIFQGGIQALSRSYFSKIIPPEKSGEYFGVMDVFGKGASFMGTVSVSAISQITGNMSLGIMSLLVFFLVGLMMFVLSTRTPSISTETEVLTDQ